MHTYLKLSIYDKIVPYISLELHRYTIPIHLNDI